MNHHITIRNFGPIKEFKSDVMPYMVFTGPQASGKSTVARLIYFFESVSGIASYISYDKNEFEEIIKKSIINRFVSINPNFTINDNFYVKYQYSYDKHITISRKGIDISIALIVELKKILEKIDENTLIRVGEIDDCKKLLDFTNNEMLYFPAGRAGIEQLYDTITFNKRDFLLFDYVTNRVRLRHWFKTQKDSEPLLDASGFPQNVNARKLLKHSQSLIKGEYIFKNNDDYLEIENGVSIKLIDASSGQQEMIWILNYFYYLLTQEHSAFLVIEEPEAHLYPDAQLRLMEIISLFYNANPNNRIMITTHSPYILGALNNFVFASQVKKKGVADIIKQNLQVKQKDMMAYHFGYGEYESAVAKDGLIKNELIDGVSDEINETFEKIFNLQEGVTDGLPD